MMRICGHSQRLRAALDALYAGAVTSKSPGAVSAFLAAAAVGLTEAAVELITATTLRPPSFAYAQSHDRFVRELMIK